MTLCERYLTALHLLVSAAAIGFSINGDDGAIILFQLIACILALVLFEKILTRFLIGTAAVFLPMLIWGAMLIKNFPSVYISKQYQERGVLAFSGAAITAVVVGIVVALVGILFHKAKRHFVAKRAGRKKPLIGPVWVWLSIFWIVFVPFFYGWAISCKLDFDHYVFFSDKRVNTVAWPIITALSGLILYAVLAAVRSRNVRNLKGVLPVEKHVNVAESVRIQENVEDKALDETIMEPQISPEPEGSSAPDQIVTGNKDSTTHGDKFDLPTGFIWWSANVAGKGFILECSGCHKNVEFKGHDDILSCKSGMGELISTGKITSTERPGLVKFAKILAGVIAVLVGTLIGSVLLGVPFLWAVIATLLYVPLKVFSEVLLAKLFPGRPVLVWTFKCGKCGNEMYVASSESIVYFTKTNKG